MTGNDETVRWLAQAPEQAMDPRLHRPGDRDGHAWVDTAGSREVYQELLIKTRRAPGPEGLRLPGFLMRPTRGAFRGEP